MTEITPTSTADLTRAEDHRKAAAYAVNAKSSATQNAYRSDWEDFVGWCRSRGYVELPASPQTVAAYLAALADVAKVSTVQRRLSAIRYAHLLSGNVTPTIDPYVREVMDGIPDPPGYSAVRATLRTLEQKGRVSHEEDGRAYIYRPTLRRDAARKSALTHVLRTFFDNSAEQAVAALLEMRGPRLSEAELERVSRMVENAKKEGR